MANEEHLKVIRQGVGAWNKWRSDNLEIRPDLKWAKLRQAYLSRADLSGADISGADLSGADLSGSNLSGSDLSGSDLRWAILSGIDFRKANLSEANLRGAVLIKAHCSQANLIGADLSEAHLSGAVFINANFSGADLSQADFSRANLSRATLIKAYLSRANLSEADISEADINQTNLSGTNLTRANLNGAEMGGTIFAYNNLITVKGLETVEHLGPSTIGIDTLVKSQGKIPEVFLRGCGLSDWQIESAKLYQLDLSNEEITNILYRIHDLRAHQAIQINPLFISYSHADSPFVDKIERYLNKKGIRFWRDIHHATAGRLETQIDRAIRLNPTVLLVLSEHSVESDWVQHEARLARKLELETKRDVLCPVALDDSWKACHWPERLREQIMEYHILNFSDWNNEEKFRGTFKGLIEGLELFYK